MAEYRKRYLYLQNEEWGGAVVRPQEWRCCVENFVEGLLTGSGASRPLLCGLEAREAQALLDASGFRGKTAQALSDLLSGLGADCEGRQELADALQHVPPELAKHLKLPSSD